MNHRPAPSRKPRSIEDHMRGLREQLQVVVEQTSSLAARLRVIEDKLGIERKPWKAPALPPSQQATEAER